MVKRDVRNMIFFLKNKNISFFLIFFVLLNLFQVAIAEQNTEQDILLVEGEGIYIGGGYSIVAKDVEVEDQRVWISLSHGDYQLMDKILENGDMLEYRDEDGNLIIAAYAENIFAGLDQELVKLNTMLYYGPPPSLFPQISAKSDGYYELTENSYFEISKGESKEICFAITNIGKASDMESYFSVSVSPGLEIESYRSSSADMNFKLSYSGSRIYDVNNNKIKSTYELLDGWKAYGPMETQTITIVVKATSSGSHWIKYRAAFDTTDAGYSFIRNPESGHSKDQQGFNSYTIPVTVISEEDTFKVKSSFTDNPPTIDGIISPNEWGKPTFDVFETENQMTGYMLNDNEYLYVAAKIPNKEFPSKTENEARTGDLVGYIFEIGFTEIITGIIDSKSIYITGNPSSHYSDSFQSSEFVFEEDDISNGEGSADHSNYNGIGDYFFEFKIPLDSDDSQDISLIDNEIEMQIFLIEIIEGTYEAHSIIEWPLQVNWRHDYAKLELSDVEVVAASTPIITGVNFIDENGDGIPGLVSHKQIIWDNFKKPVYSRSDMNVKIKIDVSGGTSPFNFNYDLSLGDFILSGTDSDHDSFIEIPLSDFPSAPIGEYILKIKVLDDAGKENISVPSNLFVILNTDIDYSNPPDNGYLSRNIVYTDRYGPNPISLIQLKIFMNKTYNVSIEPNIMFFYAINVANNTYNNQEIEKKIIEDISYRKYKSHICYSSDIENLDKMATTGVNCAGKTAVFISAARSIGIPTREVVIYTDIFGIHLPQHEFVEIYNGYDWIPSDPTKNYYGWEEFKKPLNVSKIYSVTAYDAFGNSIDRLDAYKKEGKI